MVVRRWLLYAFGAPDVPMLKIGRAYDPDERIKTLKREARYKWLRDIVWVHPERDVTEGWVHSECTAFRVYGETFRDTPQVRALLHAVVHDVPRIRQWEADKRAWVQGCTPEIEFLNARGDVVQEAFVGSFRYQSVDPTATHVRRAKGNTNATWMNDIAMGTELCIPDPRPGILRQILVETETVHVSPPMPPWAVHGYPTVAKRRSTTYRVCTPYGEYG